MSYSFKSTTNLLTQCHSPVAEYGQHFPFLLRSKKASLSPIWWSFEGSVLTVSTWNTVANVNAKLEPRPCPLPDTYLNKVGSSYSYRCYLMPITAALYDRHRASVDQQQQSVLYPQSKWTRVNKKSTLTYHPMRPRLPLNKNIGNQKANVKLSANELTFTQNHLHWTTTTTVLSAGIRR